MQPARPAGKQATEGRCAEHSCGRPGPGSCACLSVLPFAVSKPSQQPVGPVHQSGPPVWVLTGEHSEQLHCAALSLPAVRG